MAPKQQQSQGTKAKGKAVAKEEKKQAKVAKTQPKEEAVLSQPAQAAPKKGKAAAAAPAVAAAPEKKQKRKKQADAPKKPMSAFFCFQMARRAGLKGEAPELNHKDIIKRMTEEWKALTDDEKVQYVGASNREKQRYEGEMRVFRDKKARELAAEKAQAVVAKPAEKLVGAKRPASAATAKGEGKASKKSKGAPAGATVAPAAPVAPAQPASTPAQAPAQAATLVVKKGGKSATPGKKSATKASTPAKKPAEAAKASAKKKETPAKAPTPAKKSTAKKSPQKAGATPAKASATPIQIRVHVAEPVAEEVPQVIEEVFNIVEEDHLVEEVQAGGPLAGVVDYNIGHYVADDVDPADAGDLEDEPEEIDGGAEVDGRFPLGGEVADAPGDVNPAEE